MFHAKGLDADLVFESWDLVQRRCTLADGDFPIDWQCLAVAPDATTRKIVERREVGVAHLQQRTRVATVSDLLEGGVLLVGLDTFEPHPVLGDIR